MCHIFYLPNGFFVCIIPYFFQLVNKIKGVSLDFFKTSATLAPFSSTTPPPLSLLLPCCLCQN
jgi:hypothetical protein